MEDSSVAEPTGFSTEDSSPDSSELERTATDGGAVSDAPESRPLEKDVEDRAGTSADQPSIKDRKNGLFPDLTTVDWYLDPRFQRYWKHYHQVMTWYQKHLETYRMLTSSLNSSQSPHQASCANVSSARFSPYSSPHRTPQPPRFRTAGRGTGPSAKTSTGTTFSLWPRHTHHGETKPQSNKSYRSGDTTPAGCTATSDSKPTNAVHTEEFEMEITDEMVEFFSQSRRHKKERDAARKTSPGDDDKDEHVNLEQAISQRKSATTEAPKERPGVRRTHEMKMLYGKGAAMIHGMETAIQMSFDRNTDIHQPKLWPNMPLKIVFG